MARNGGKDRGLFEKPTGSGVWWILYYDQDGQRHREKVGSKKLARDLYAKRKTEIREGRFFPESHSKRERISVRSAVEQYMVVAAANRSHKTDIYHARHVTEAFGKVLVDQLRPHDIERWMAERVKKVAPSSVNRTFGFLKRVCRKAVRDGSALVDPTSKVKAFREPSGRIRFLTHEEEQRLREVFPVEHWHLLEFALLTGLRRAEQFGLRWEDVDFRNGVITIPRSKNGGRRHVPMNSRVREILLGLPSRLRSPWVFANGNDEPRDPNNFINRVFRPALRRANIADFHWHDARHTFASRLVMNGVDLRTVQELMGHRDISMTVRYSHLAPSHLAAAVESLCARPVLAEEAPATPTATKTATKRKARRPEEG